MLLNIAMPGDFLVLEKDIESPGSGDQNTPGPNHVLTSVQAIKQPQGYKWLKYPLLRGEWYEVVSLYIVENFVRDQLGPVMVQVLLTKKDPDRLWCKEKVQSIAPGSLNRQLSLRAIDINGKCLVVKTKDQAMHVSQQLKDSYPQPEQQVNRFKQLLK